MIRRVGRQPGLALAALVLAVACERSPEADASARTQPSSTAGRTYSVDMDAIFPPGSGRELVLANCQSCHIWVPIVILQMNEEEWARNQLDHRGRVEGLSDEDFETLYEYLVTTFTPDRPVPELPPALLEAWTSY